MATPSKSLNVARPKKSAFYRMVYDATSKKAKLWFHNGYTYCPPHLYLFCSEAWSEILSHASSLGLTGLPLDDPAKVPKAKPSVS